MKRIFSSILLVVLAVAAMAQTPVKKPTIMVFPSDAWCIQNGYYSDVENMDQITRVPNYKTALQENIGLKLAIAKLEELMANRQFPLEDLEQTIKNIELRRAEDNLTVSKNGNDLAESPLDELARTAKSDIIMELTWEVKDMGPKHSITYILSGKDAYTGKTIASVSGAGKPSMTADVDVLLEEAIVEKFDPFTDQLMAHFEELQTIGREIVLDIKVFAGNEAGIDLESEFGDDELTDIIQRWMFQNTVSGRFSTAYASENVINFNQVRIPLYDEYGIPMDAQGFAKQLQKKLKKEPYRIPSKVMMKGLGRAVIVLGEK